LTGTAALSTFAVGFEGSATQGRQTLLTPTTAAATMSATTQPAGSTTGVRCQILVTGIATGASATISIAGKLADGVTSSTETTTAISQATMRTDGVFEYTTSALYGSINASGITCSSVTSNALTGATVTVYGIVAAKWLVPATAKFVADYDEYSPNENRGILDEDTRMTQLIKKVTWDLSGSLYPEASQFFLPACVGNVTNPTTPASNPSTPTSLKASTSFTSLGASYTLTTAPTAPGMLISFVISGNALAGTLTITGTKPSADGGAFSTSEVLSIVAGTPNGTFYSANVYASVTNIAVTGFTPAALCVTNGVFAYNPVYNPTNSLTSLTGEWFDGTASWIAPWMVPESFDITYDVNKELTFAAKGSAQDLIPIGDVTPTSQLTSRFATYAQPSDFPIVGWPGIFYLDAITGTAGTTQQTNIITFKISGTTGLVPYWTAVQQQQFNNVGRKKRKTTFEAEVDFTNLVQYATKYKGFTKQIFVAKFIAPGAGGYIGPGVYKYVQFILNAREVKFETEPKDEKVTAKISGTCEYEPSIGYAFQVSLLNQNNPNYAV
jgi:hypothetical protein